MMNTVRTIAGRALSALPLLGATLAQAHDGHGQGAGSHWHATDGWGLGLALALAAALWWSRRR